MGFYFQISNLAFSGFRNLNKYAIDPNHNNLADLSAPINEIRTNPQTSERIILGFKTLKAPIPATKARLARL